MPKLHYVDPNLPGITRHRLGDGFEYRDAHGASIKAERTLERIRALVIPPAWRDVWICRSPNGHIQAIGTDERGRRQYRYHAQFRAERDEAKYSRILTFAKLLPALRARIEADMAKPGLGFETVAATVVHLLETTMIRVGNSQYAKENKTYGLSTLQNRHARIEGSTLRFSFKGKSGKQWLISVRDRRAAKIVRACQELPGQQLFQYLDEDGERRTIDSRDINAYLREVTGKSITAKDFRTWAGTVFCALALGEKAAKPSASAVKRQIAEAVRTVATKLGNTPAICRSCYIHPEIMTAFADGHLARHMARVLEAEVEKHELRPEENAVLSLLGQRLRMQRKLARQKAAGKIKGDLREKPVRSRSPKPAPELRAAA